jgi:peptidoglycan/LPS O-acetylase OafA/YrhL
MSDAQRTIGLDLPRAIAISLVILAHFGGLNVGYLGFFGVELFFSLSGFLIGSILYRDFTLRREWSFSDIRVFWARRWWRTLPNYYLFLLISIPFHYYFGGLPSPVHFLRYLVFTQNLMTGDNPFYGVSWSLAIEEWFYLLFPLALLCFSVCGASKRVAFVLTTALFVTCPIALRELLLVDTPATAVHLMTIPRLDAVFYGVAISFWTNRRQLGHGTRLLAMIGGVAMVTPFLALFAMHRDGTAVYRVAFVAVPLGFALTMPFLRTIRELPKAIRTWSGAVQSASLWSYSLYLMHVPVLLTVYALFGASRQSVAVDLLSKVTALLLCIVLSKLLYERFEAPLTRRRPGDLRPPSTPDTSSSVLTRP